MKIVYPIIGLTYEQAADILTERGAEFRLTCKNGEPRIVTQDYHPARVNIVIESDKVARYSFG